MKKTFILLTMLTLISHYAFAQDKKITVVSCNWEPHFGEKLENGGYFTEIVTESFKRGGYSAEAKFLPWKRALETSKNGKYEVLFGAYYSEERTKHFKYSDMIADETLCFFSKKGRGIKYKSLKDLAPYKIGFLRGSTYGKDFDEADYLKKDPVTNNELNVKKLMKGRIDLVLSSKVSFLSLINTDFPKFKGQVEIADPPLQVSNMYIAVSKKVPGYEKMIEDFNKGLKLLKEDGSFDKIMKKHGF